jgi:tetratricopeptide (TPR) repeat protein
MKNSFLGPRGHRLLPLFLAVLLASCAAPPVAPPPPAPAPAPSIPAPPPPQPAPEPAPPEAPTLSSPQAIQRAVVTAIEQLENGQEEAALAELEMVLQADPNQRLAQSLLRQIKEDPVSMLGRESFPYRVQAGESLSSIAGRYLRDVYLFYALARYNGIKVPRQLAGGQTIRIPGKAPGPGAAPPAVPGTAPAAPAAAAPAAPVPPVPAPAPPPAPVAAPPAAVAPPAAPTESRSALVARYQREARAAFAKQDLEGAIRAWDKVLEIDPDNRNAQLERQRAKDLCKRLNDLTKGPPKAC